MTTNSSEQKVQYVRQMLWPKTGLDGANVFCIDVDEVVWLNEWMNE